MLVIGFTACNKSDTGIVNDQNQNLQKRGTISEEYVYHGVHYILYFNDDDTSSTPNNTSTADSLINAIGSSPYVIAYYEDYPNITYVEDLPSDNDSDTTLAQISPNSCVYAEFFEHTNFQGSSFCVDNYFDRHEGLLVLGNLCSEYIGESNLANRPYSLSQSWNDRISSFKMFRDGASKTWYDNNGYSGTGTSVTFALFRNSNYDVGGCKYTRWVMNLPSPGNTESAWTVSNLNKERWGFLCKDMNDKVSSIGMIPCKCSICFAP